MKNRKTMLKIFFLAFLIIMSMQVLPSVVAKPPPPEWYIVPHTETDNMNNPPTVYQDIWSDAATSGTTIYRQNKDDRGSIKYINDGTGYQESHMYKSVDYDSNTGYQELKMNIKSGFNYEMYHVREYVGTQYVQLNGVGRCQADYYYTAFGVCRLEVTTTFWYWASNGWNIVAIVNYSWSGIFTDFIYGITFKMILENGVVSFYSGSELEFRGAHSVGYHSNQVFCYNEIPSTTPIKYLGFDDYYYQYRELVYTGW